MPSTNTTDSSTGDFAVRAPIRTAAELADRLGPLPLHRYVGIAESPRDLFDLHEAGRNVELVDGALLERADSHRAQQLAETLRRLVERSCTERRLGLVGGTNVLLRLSAERFRLASVVLLDVQRADEISRDRRFVAEMPPVLAIEVLGSDNTGEEMEDKLRDYFVAGTRLVWYVYPQARSVHVYTSLESVEMLEPTGRLDGGDVVPGLSIDLTGLFESDHPVGQAPA